MNNHTKTRFSNLQTASSCYCIRHMKRIVANYQIYYEIDEYSCQLRTHKTFALL
jgi:hypothetical protein